MENTEYLGPNDFIVMLCIRHVVLNTPFDTELDSGPFDIHNTTLAFESRGDGRGPPRGHK